MKPLKVYRPPNKAYSMDIGIKSLKISAHSYHPPSKMNSSLSVNSYKSVPIEINENEDLKSITRTKYTKEKEKILKMTTEEIWNVIVDSNGKQSFLYFTIGSRI